LTGNETVLDICCANGRQTRNLSSLFPQGSIIGVDINPKMIHYAQRNNTEANVKFLCADINHLPFPAESFDIVSSFLALHEIPTKQLRPVIQEVHRVLKKQGFLLVLDFQAPVKSLSSLYLRYYGLRLFEDDSAAFFMNLPHRGLFEKFGFKVLAHCSFFRGLLFAMLLQPQSL